MIKVLKILLKIRENYKSTNFVSLKILEENLFKITCSNCTVSFWLTVNKIWQYNARKLQWNKSSGPDPLTIKDPARIASKLRNRLSRPEPGQAGPARLIPLVCIT